MKLINQNIEVELVLSEPWGFLETEGECRMRGKIILSGRTGEEEKMLLALDDVLVIKKIKCQHFVCLPRYTKDKGKLISLLINDKKVYCNFIYIPKERAVSENPMDLSWWRGGVAGIGYIKKRMGRK